MLDYGHEGKPKLMDTGDLAEYLNVPKSWVYQHVKEIPHFKLCGLLRFEQAKIDQWLASQEVKVDNNSKRKPSGSRRVKQSRGNIVERHLPRKGVKSKH